MPRQYILSSSNLSSVLFLLSFQNESLFRILSSVTDSTQITLRKKEREREFMINISRSPVAGLTSSFSISLENGVL